MAIATAAPVLISILVVVLPASVAPLPRPMSSTMFIPVSVVVMSVAPFFIVPLVFLVSYPSQLLELPPFRRIIQYRLISRLLLPFNRQQGIFTYLIGSIPDRIRILHGHETRLRPILLQRIRLRCFLSFEYLMNPLLPK